MCLRNENKPVGWNILSERDMAEDKIKGLGRNQIIQALLVKLIIQSPKIENKDLNVDLKLYI